MALGYGLPSVLPKGHTNAPGFAPSTVYNIPGYNYSIPAPSPPINPSNSTNSIKILSQSEYVDSASFVHVIGEVDNVGSVSLGGVLVVASFQARNGTVSSVGNYSFVNILTPNQKSPFDINSSFANSVVVNYSIKVLSALPAATESFVGLHIFGNSSDIDSAGDYSVAGKIGNSGNTTAQYIQVIGTFYNSAGKIVAAVLVLSYPNNLDPQQTGSFNITVSVNVNEVASYYLQLQIQGLDSIGGGGAAGIRRLDSRLE